MNILILAFLIIVGLVVLTVFGIMAFPSVQDYLEERKHWVVFLHFEEFKEEKNEL